MKAPALAWFAKQFIGVTDPGAMSVVNRFRLAVDGKAQGEAWCLCFVQYLAREVDNLFAEMGLPAMPTQNLFATESTQELWLHAKNVSTTAKIGAIAVWRSKLNPAHGHCGVVIATGPDGIMTVEGNTSDPNVGGSESAGRGVWRKSRFGGAVPGFDLLGYVLPWP